MGHLLGYRRSQRIADGDFPYLPDTIIGKRLIEVGGVTIVPDDADPVRAEIVNSHRERLAEYPEAFRTKVKDFFDSGHFLARAIDEIIDEDLGIKRSS